MFPQSLFPATTRLRPTARERLGAAHGRGRRKLLRCSGAKLTRLVSPFAFARGDEAPLDRLAGDAALAGVDENAPKSMAAS
ncbi:MAG TPA: hypothetical protein VKU01_32485 [Bryobacteraceae bacterium]|nr:hypothetical protein [Bryobacteraceae bacterium]